jgi:DNA invertase Pin-like site-specific DNA recombinase
METATNVLAYLRVSTQEQSDSGLGLEAQRAAIAGEAARRGWAVDWYVDDGYTAANLERPALHTLLARLRRKEASTLVVSKLDRLSRSLMDFAGLMELARKEGWNLIALDLGIDLSTPSGALMANVMASFAEYERRLISQRTKDALQALKDRGVRLGRPVVLPPSVRAAVQAWRAAGCTLADVAALLNEVGVPTAHGGEMWRPSTVKGVLRSLALDEAVA